ncbi:hypothetical protein S8c_00061 [Klebsiella phage VLCpiS8c]|nr:hypothetical protein S8c_00061 [Klebsiella phage VLCpiS8c]
MHRCIGRADLRFDFVFCRQQVGRSLGRHFCVVGFSLGDSVSHVVRRFICGRQISSLSVEDLLSDSLRVIRTGVSGCGDILGVLRDFSGLVVQLLLLLLVGCHSAVSSHLRGLGGILRSLRAVAYLFDAVGKLAVGVRAFDRVVNVLVVVVHVVGRHSHNRGVPRPSVAIRRHEARANLNTFSEPETVLRECAGRVGDYRQVNPVANR